ncbi:MAG: site-specific DNA-methyltransferase [Phycisphaerae bacterium]|nr:site-specific DNA-methyltransferase [Phycisphaerae bacterium]
MMRSQDDTSCDLIYLDPPFMTQRVQATQAGAVFDDRWPGGFREYLAFLRPRLEQARRLLAQSGSLYLHLDWRTVHYVKCLADEIFGIENFLNEIVWSYRTGGRSDRWFARKHDTLLLYAKQAGRHVFHVQRNGSFRTDGLLYDDTGRPYKKTRKGRLYFHPDGPACTDVWEIPFLSTVSCERTGYPAQKPEALLERIIRTSTDPGQLVADFFCGSGTTLAVAKRLGRRYFGCDVSHEAVTVTRQRLRSVPACKRPAAD